MTTAEATTAITAASQEDRDHKRSLALLKAVGLDRAAPEQRELALAIAKRYELDLLLKHLVLIDGKPYVTRDALLWIAHRSGQLDGIEVTRPVVEGDYWYCEATVYRKDMSHPFTYGGRYPVKGKNANFAPEMATKVAESMALRRAFNISAPTQDERWDVDVPVTEPDKPTTLAEKVASKVEVINADELPETQKARADEADGSTPSVTVETSANAEQPIPESAPIPERTFEGKSPLEQALQPMRQCESKSPMTAEGEPPVQCRREEGHKGVHRTENESWAA